MLCKNRDIYGFWGTSWVPITYITCPPVIAQTCGIRVVAHKLHSYQAYTLCTGRPARSGIGVGATKNGIESARAPCAARVLVDTNMMESPDGGLSQFARTRSVSSRTGSITIVVWSTSVLMANLCLAVRQTGKS